jgi:hypothetical protein
MATQSPARPDADSVRALEYAVDRALRAPSVHNTQPWTFILDGDVLHVRADRSRQLNAVDPRGRELVQSVGAAMLNLRVGLAARNWAADITRLPDRDDPDLIAVVRPVRGIAEPDLADLDPAIARRHTNRRRYLPATVPEEVLRRLAEVSAEEQTELVPVLTEARRQLVARLTRQADRWQNADPAYRAELRRWTTRPPETRDGVPASVVPHADGVRDEVPIRDFDTAGAGELPSDTGSTADQTLVLLTTLADDPLAWLRSGEALERVLLEVAQLGYVAGPITQAVEVPLTRSQLRAALSWGTHPQMLLRIGTAAPTPLTPRRRRSEMVHGGAPPGEPPPVHLQSTPTVEPGDELSRRPVSDGRGGTTWV